MNEDGSFGIQYLVFNKKATRERQERTIKPAKQIFLQA